jgi:hypothetical protein
VQTKKLSENFIGGFCGGLLGIIMFGSIHPVALVLAVFFGVIAGWWHQKIWSATMASARQGVDRTRKLMNRIVGVEHAKVHEGDSLKSAWLRYAKSRFVNLLGASIRFSRRPVVQMRAVNAGAVITNIALHSLWIVPLVFSLRLDPERKLDDSFFSSLCVFTFVVSSIAMMSLAFVSLLDINPTSPLMSSCAIENSRLEKYKARGAFGFFIAQSAEILGIQLLVVVWAARLLGFGIVAVLWFAGPGALFLLFAVTPISGAIGGAKYFYWASKRREHWTCLAVTLVVTAISAITMQSYFGDLRILWGTALVTGVLSGIASEAAHRAIQTYCARSEALKEFAKRGIEDRLAPMNTRFARMTEDVLRYAGQKLLHLGA